MIFILIVFKIPYNAIYFLSIFEYTAFIFNVNSLSLLIAILKLKFEFTY